MQRFHSGTQSQVPSPTVVQNPLHSTATSSSHSSCLGILRTGITGVYHMSSSPHTPKEQSKACYGLGLTSTPNRSSGGGAPSPEPRQEVYLGRLRREPQQNLTVGWLANHPMLHSSTQKEEHWLQAASSLLSST